MLDRTAQSVFASRRRRERAQGVEIDIHACDRTVGKHDAAVTCASLHADLADTSQIAATRCYLGVVSAHECMQIFNAAVAGADLAYLASDRDRDPFGFKGSNVFGDVRGEDVIDLLLCLQRWQRKINRRSMRRCRY